MREKIKAVRLQDKIGQIVCSKTEPLKTAKTLDITRVYQFSNGSMKGLTKLRYDKVIHVFYDSVLKAWTY